MEQTTIIAKGRKLANIVADQRKVYNHSINLSIALDMVGNFIFCYDTSHR